MTHYAVLYNDGRESLSNNYAYRIYRIFDSRAEAWDYANSRGGGRKFYRVRPLNLADGFYNNKAREFAANKYPELNIIEETQ